MRARTLTPAPSSATLRGSLMMIAMTLFIAVDAAVARVVAETIHPLEIVFFRVLFGLLLLLPWLLHKGPAALRSGRYGLHALRAALKILALVAYFYALTVMPLADVTAIAFAMPLFATAGAVLVLGERMRKRRWLAIAVGFAGVLIVLRPGASVLEPGAVAALASALGIATVGLMVKVLAREDGADSIVAINLLLSVPLALLPALLVWVTPDPLTLALMGVQGALGVGAQLCFTRAMKLADASLLMPLDFMRLPFVIAIGYLAFAEVPDLWTLVGGAVIFSASVYLARREQ